MEDFEKQSEELFNTINFIFPTLKRRKTKQMETNFLSRLVDQSIPIKFSKDFSNSSSSYKIKSKLDKAICVKNMVKRHRHIDVELKHYECLNSYVKYLAM
jgi:superfamily I DNA and/or RNA helicase